MTQFVGEIQQRRQHPCSQFYGYRFYPIKRLTNRQLIQYFPGTLTDQPFHLFQVFRGHHILYRFTLLIVFGRVHGDEGFNLQAFRGTSQGNDRLGRKQIMVLVHEDDVVITGNRPERTKGTVFLVVHGALIAQTLEVGLPFLLPKQKRATDVNIFNGQRIHFRERALNKSGHIGPFE